MIFQYNNSNISFEVDGHGPVIVLLHGFLESSTMWQRLISEFNSEYTFICIDLPGHGKSEVVALEHSMELMAEIVHALLTHLNIESANFIGHSMGGYVLLAFLELYPSKVSNLILLNSTPFADSADRSLNRERALELIPKNPNLFITSAINNLFVENGRSQFSKDIEQLQSEARNFPIDGIMAMIRGMKNRPDRVGVLKKFNGQKLLACGDKDTIIPISESKAAASTTNSSLKIVNASHMILIENWSEFVKIMHFIDFL